jgi:hypothetical protein
MNINTMVFVRKLLIWSFAIGTTVAFTTQCTRSTRVEVGFTGSHNNKHTSCRRRVIIKSPMMKISWSSSRKRKLAYAYDDSTFSNTALIEEEEKKLLMSRIPSPSTNTNDGEKMSKLQIEFRKLLEGILYTPKEIESILNPNMRSILEGISASYYEHAVYRAFEILYEDYIPLRIAGRIVYKQLRKVMDESKQYQESQIRAVMDRTGMSRSSIKDCWSIFIQIVDSGRTISLDELQKYIKEPQTMDFILTSSNIDSSSERTQTGDDDDDSDSISISFEQLLTSLHNINNLRHNDNFDWGGDSNNNNNNNNDKKKNSMDANILQQALNLNLNSKINLENNNSKKRQKYIQKYDDMIIQFSKWKPLISTSSDDNDDNDEGSSRRMQVLKGCFVGSENPAVLEALKIIYVDYGALRLSGDWIFKVVSTLMGPIVRRHERRQLSQ